MVVDDGLTDRTVEVLELLELPGLEVIKPNHGGKARALNEGLGLVRHGIVISKDANTPRSCAGCRSGTTSRRYAL